MCHASGGHQRCQILLVSMSNGSRFQTTSSSLQSGLISVPLTINPTFQTLNLFESHSFNTRTRAPPKQCFPSQPLAYMLGLNIMLREILLKIIPHLGIVLMFLIAVPCPVGDCEGPAALKHEGNRCLGDLGHRRRLRSGCRKFLAGELATCRRDTWSGNQQTS